MEVTTQPEASPPGRQNGQRRRRITVALLGIGAVLVLVWVVISSQGYEFYTVPTAEMEPTIPFGGRIVVEPLADDDARQRLTTGDIVFFPTPGNTADRTISRIVAVGGDRIRIDAKTVTVDGTRLEEPHAIWIEPPDGTPGPAARPAEETVVPDGYVFVLGDHRNLAVDSRVFGPIPRSTIAGRIVSTY